MNTRDHAGRCGGRHQLAARLRRACGGDELVRGQGPTLTECFLPSATPCGATITYRLATTDTDLAASLPTTTIAPEALFLRFEFLEDAAIWTPLLLSESRS